MLIYIPGKGYLPQNAYNVDKAVNEYDERLYFSRNVDTGDWCIYIKTPANTSDVALIGWRENEIPSPDIAVKWLYEHDMVRHGTKLLDDLNRHNAEIQKQRDYERSELTGEMAEHLEVVSRWLGKHPEKRVFVPGDID